MNKIRGYIFSRPFMGERAPQHVQNIVIRDYCQRHGLQFLLSATEYAMQDSYLILEEVLSELTEISGFVAYSLFQLPEDKLLRNEIYRRVVSQGKTLHFAVEDLCASTLIECERLEAIWLTRAAMQSPLS